MSTKTADATDPSTRATTNRWRSALVALRVLASRLPKHPARQVLLGYALYIGIGCLLLCMPIAQRGGTVSFLDNLFIATSAVSTTGLVTVSISDDYTFFGQVVVLALTRTNHTLFV